MCRDVFLIVYSRGVNGDGYDDFLIGALANNDGGDWTGLSLADASFIGEDIFDQAGKEGLSVPVLNPLVF